MDDAGFRAWLLGEGRDSAVELPAANHRVDRLRKLEENLARLGVAATTLDEAFEMDRLVSTTAAVAALQSDFKSGGQRYRILMPKSEAPKNRLANMKRFVGQYRDYLDFKNGVNLKDSDADRIRKYALDSHITPARERGDELVQIVTLEVNRALGLNQAWPNIQQSLEGQKFLEMAEVEAPLRKGPRQSTTTAFTFYLGEEPLQVTTICNALRLQFGEPVKDVVRMFAVQTPDGRQIGLDPSPGGGALLWIEAETPLPSDIDVKRYYAPQEARHHGLTSRLSSKPADARPVALCRVQSWAALRAVVSHHQAKNVTETQPAHSQPTAGIDMPEPTNLILYGPPGTGKTFETAERAVRLCSPGFVAETRGQLMEEYDRLLDIGQIEFVTFHQSYSYEDFVEGLRPPVIDEDADEPTQEVEGGLRLELRPGAFRRIATRAQTSRGVTAEPFDLEGRQVFKMSIGVAADPDDAYLFTEAIAEGYVYLGFGEIDWSDEQFSNRQSIVEKWRAVDGETDDPASPSSARVQVHDRFRNKLKVGDLVIVSKGNKAFRAIGVVTGGYEFAPREEGGYAHRRKVDWLWHDADGVPHDEIISKRFSMVSIYKIDPSILKTNALQRYVAREAPNGPPAQFVLIIDEINRANISKVFGELITLLEPDKRLTPGGGGLRVRLPYSQKMFGVPANLHIIGTMNTADRSIALLDTALRRRFEFQELMPRTDLDEMVAASKATGVDLGKLLQRLNERIEYLFDREHQIGHAYFLKCKTKADVDNVMRLKVIPLLIEYFYEDWRRVALVLGDADGEGRFLERTELKPVADGSDDAEPRYRWSVAPDFKSDCYSALA